MKHLSLTLLLILIAGMGMAQTKQFHVRVESISNEYCDHYVIKFTEDNWETTHQIYDSFDYSFDGQYGDRLSSVCFQEKIFSPGGYDNPKQAAINFAKKFHFAYECYRWNEKQNINYHRLLAYRTLHPVKLQTELTTKKQCCTITQVY